MISLIFSTPVYADEVGETIHEVGNLAGLISEYGPITILLSIFFIAFMTMMILILRSNIKLTKRLINSNKGTDELESDLLTKFVEGALQTLTRQTTSHDSSATKEEDYHKDLVGAYIDVNMAFKDASRQALNDLKCNRIAIYMFHNGNASVMGLPFFKMSCIHEWNRNNATTTLRGKSHSDMPLHLFSDFIEDLWKDGYYRAEDISAKSAIDNSINEFVAFSETKALYLIAIKSNEGSIAGFVGAEFDRVDTFEQDEQRDSEVKEILSEMVTKITPIVGNKYVFKKK